MEAARTGDLERVKQLARDGAPVNWANADGSTALHFAAANGHVAMVRCLGKELNADINQADKAGFTPLHVAAVRGHVTVMRCLCKELNADVNQAAKDGYTALVVADQAVCRKKWCTICHKVRYRGRECQLAHWPVHKKECGKQ